MLVYEMVGITTMEGLQFSGSGSYISVVGCVWLSEYPTCGLGFGVPNVLALCKLRPEDQSPRLSPASSP